MQGVWFLILVTLIEFRLKYHVFLCSLVKCISCKPYQEYSGIEY